MHKLLFVISEFYPNYTRELFFGAFNFLLKQISKRDNRYYSLDEDFNIEIYESKPLCEISASDLEEKVLKIILQNKCANFIIKNKTNNLKTNLYVLVTSGSLEIPQAASLFLQKYKVDGMIALGVIKKGMTDHDKYVTTECYRGIGEIALKYSIPFVNGVISANTDELILNRVSRDSQNIGEKTLKTCLEMILLKEKIYKIL